MPVCGTLAINAILGNADGIDNTTATSWTWRIDGDVLRLSNIPATTHIFLYDAQGVLCSQTVANESEIELPIYQKLYILKVGSNAIKIVR